MNTQAINIIFDGPPGPETPRFVEVENDNRQSIGVGEWIERDDGWWALRITKLPEAIPLTPGQLVYVRAEKGTILVWELAIFQSIEGSLLRDDGGICWSEWRLPTTEEWATLRGKQDD